jgi:hypothetical protein
MTFLNAGNNCGMRFCIIAARKTSDRHKRGMQYEKGSTAHLRLCDSSAGDELLSRTTNAKAQFADALITNCSQYRYPRLTTLFLCVGECKAGF